MRKFLLTGAMLITAASSFAVQASQDQTPQSNVVTNKVVACDALKEQIAQKIINNGVKQADFKLEVIDNDQAVNDGEKVVGSCNRGKQKIIYTRLSHSNDESQSTQ
ncbi:DUF1161 domain-containing protein [Xenorhabdus innexi]|uniref:Membrane protein n=1 Tax=Xenorhabdus innexi TaxID=290109 RepID=A0A1N6MY65_9GAMM|nr:DUF1161 domain-containing protein [Xenorhabdus innexi]PHM38829.1 membrane protein [Xenorhabdus innexi]SIP73727.1 conserved exported hypothetical protein [Xenorhabdus innexi]